ncbi:hypothetical protein BUE80_DR008183 [Diplocarpon rosae]|nr:hypothetical protein BUE80_DR008183 [Diplocarpon rosae]
MPHRTAPHRVPKAHINLVIPGRTEDNASDAALGSCHCQAPGTAGTVGIFGVHIELDIRLPRPRVKKKNQVLPCAPPRYTDRSNLQHARSTDDPRRPGGPLPQPDGCARAE